MACCSAYHLTAPASMKANPHCMKKMMMDMMSRKKWSTSFGIGSSGSVSFHKVAFIADV
jgi:hypothetical protein